MSVDDPSFEQSLRVTLATAADELESEPTDIDAVIAIGRRRLAIQGRNSAFLLAAAGIFLVLAGISVRAAANPRHPGSVVPSATIVSAQTSGPLAIVTKSLQAGIVGQVYSDALVATGGTKPYTWSVISGRLPPGLTLSSDGSISGTPTHQWDRSFTVEVQDAQANMEKATFTITVG